MNNSSYEKASESIYREYMFPDLTDRKRKSKVRRDD